MVNIGVSIAVAAAFPGAGNLIGNALLNTVDDAVFTLANVATGQMTWDEGLFSIAQAGVGSVVSAKIGDMFGGLTVADPTNIGQVVGNSLVKGMEKAMSNVTVGAINAIQYRSGEGFGFNTSQYVNGIVGKDALASYAGVMAGEFAKGSLNMFDMHSALGTNVTNGIGVNTDNIRAFNGVIGNVVNAGVEYGISGHTTVNLLNFRDIAKAFKWDWFQTVATDDDGNVKTTADGQIIRTGQWNSVGLLEFSIDSRRGISSRIGMNGIDLSLGNIAEAFQGLGDVGKIASFKLGGVEGNTTFEGITLLGQTNIDENHELAKKLLNRELEAEYKEGITDKVGHTALGYYDKSESANSITLNSSLLGGDKETMAKLASVMSHEGSHYMGEYL